MDITLIRTFLEVASSGSFVSAAEQLLVSQSAVSLRIQRLEDTLGRPLFTRSRNGAVLTHAGEVFGRYALNMIKLWEETRQQVAIPEGFNRSLTIGAQHSLWPRLGFRWLDMLRQTTPELNLKTEVGMPDRLIRFLIDGSAQVALVYQPTIRPGLEVTELAEDRLVMVAGIPDWDMDGDHPYVMMDWGPEFQHHHTTHLPQLTHSGITLTLGGLGAEYLVGRPAAGYMPAGSVAGHIDSGRLHLITEAPEFPLSIWAVWRDDLEPIIRAAAETALLRIAHRFEEDSERIAEDVDEPDSADT